MHDDIRSVLAIVLRSEVAELMESIQNVQASRAGALGASLAQIIRSPGIKSFISLGALHKRISSGKSAKEIVNNNKPDNRLLAHLGYTGSTESRAYFESDIDTLLRIMDDSVGSCTLTVLAADPRIARRLSRLALCGWRIIWAPQPHESNNHAVRHYMSANAGVQIMDVSG